MLYAFGGAILVALLLVVLPLPLLIAEIGNVESVALRNSLLVIVPAVAAAIFCYFKYVRELIGALWLVDLPVLAIVYLGPWTGLILLRKQIRSKEDGKPPSILG